MIHFGRTIISEVFTTQTTYGYNYVMSHIRWHNDGTLGRCPKHRQPICHCQHQKCRWHECVILRDRGPKTKSDRNRRRKTWWNIWCLCEDESVSIHTRIRQYILRLVHLNDNVHYQWHLHVPDVRIHKEFFRDAFFNYLILV